MPRPTGQHRAEGRAQLRPNYRRMGFAGAAFAITLVALLAGIGVIPLQHRQPAAAETHLPATSQQATVRSLAAGAQPVDRRAAGTSGISRASTALPTNSGHGRRIVFDISDQRVWLVGHGDDVASTYLVSGSLTDNLHPGSYAVYSRSRWAVGVDDSGVMQYFVRFAHGKHAAIGFHSIPTKHGQPLQTRAELGRPASHGCIRQWLPDAIRLWRFAPVGTKVVVTA
ncbi:L,D-transpeptidase [Nocardioides terrisoli]|uniref:L,D-transpeptidase n=1 Tax=Nocardioides terrisoli TaxID=3388267 RepID=UPI00287B84C6|nr:L,D-transpeptidase [Nocardioides marmorisolisilvae]